MTTLAMIDASFQGRSPNLGVDPTYIPGVTTVQTIGSQTFVVLLLLPS